MSDKQKILDLKALTKSALVDEVLILDREIEKLQKRAHRLQKRLDEYEQPTDISEVNL